MTHCNGKSNGCPGGMGRGGYVKGFFVGILLIGLVLTLGTLSAALALTEEETKRAEALIPLLEDRKSTRLNSSHSQISYAVFCLKKKKHCKDAVSEDFSSLQPGRLPTTI